MSRHPLRLAVASILLVMAFGSTAGAQEPVNLTHWYYNFPPFADYQRSRIESFKEINPNVTVEYDSSVSPVGEGGFEDKIDRVAGCRHGARRLLGHLAAGAAHHRARPARADR